MSEFYTFSATTLRGVPVSMADYAGKVVVVVNTASKCGFTPQYAGLEALYQRYAAQGLVILAFPCNQFGHQEPGDAQTIEGNCLINYGVSFPVFQKTEVLGHHAHPLFQWLSAELPGLGWRGIKWNFTKFLIDRQGKPLRRYSPLTPPDKMESAIKAALGNAIPLT